ncbi:Transcriptional regulatory protein LiaR [compost metagenome]
MLTACDLKFRQALLAYKAGNLVAARVWLLRGLEESKPMQNRLSMEHLERTYPELCALVEREKQTDLLSEREIEVLRLVEACLSNSEIGQRLFISVYTVKSHVQRICGKLGVRRRAQAVVKAKSLGIM